MKKAFFIIFLIITLLTNFFGYSVFSADMESSRFKIKGGNVNTASGEKSSTNYKLSDTVGQLAAGEFSSTGYIVKAGFQYLKSVIPFRFSVSNTNINFGILTPNSPQTSTTVLTVSFGSAGQYQVKAIEEDKMRSLNNDVIEDTSCDGGSENCTELVAKNWITNNAYGFGYNILGDDVPIDFTSSSKFRRFPNRKENEDPVVIMSNNNVGRNRQATLTFKINISPVQPAGNYQTIINFIATPSF